MIDSKQYIQNLFTQKNIEILPKRIALFEEFVKDEININAVNQIQQNQKMMIDNWELKNKISNIIDKHLVIPNATVGKPYEAILDFDKAGLNDIIYSEFEGLEEFGLTYNNQTETISGNPIQSGDLKVKLKFRISGEEENSKLNEKIIAFVVNADPKSLWKNIPSQQTEDNYWKPDHIEDFQVLGNKHLVVSSKRGRSHANVGSFRDDDFAFKHFEQTGWSIVSVADGAGGYPLTRQGSKLACNAVIEFFEENFTLEYLKDFDELLFNHHNSQSEETSTQLSHFVYNNLSKAALNAHKKIQEFATKTEKQLKDFHTTLIFALFKKYDFGYAVLSFGVGDCPIGLLNKEMSELKLMNWLDVGEFGGGTRFITMPEIFSSDKFPTRFGFKLIDDFSFLMLMTDGIYDPKFVVEANLEKLEKWKEFIDDLGGNNEDGIKVDFNLENDQIASQLSAWMDFWSPGNHDDRTLAIVF